MAPSTQEVVAPLNRFARVIAIGLLVTVLAGCTGWHLDTADKQWKLDDIYLASTGTLIHYEVGNFVADQLRALGANPAGINFDVPSTRLEVDIYGVWGSTYRIYELKPRHWFSIFDKKDQAEEQINNYRTKLQAAGYSVQLGGVWSAPAPGVVVPDSYVPEAAKNCIQVVVETHYEVSPGLIWYWYRWHPDKTNRHGTRCGRQNQAEKNETLSNFVYDAADALRYKYGQNWIARSQEKTAMTAYMDNTADMRQQTVDVYYYDDEETDDWQIDPETTKAELHNRLMGKYIPSWFYSGQTLQNPSPPMPGWDQSPTPQEHWECTNKAC